MPRPDLPALVTGKFEFVHNVRLPGMLHGRVVRPPAVGATVVNADESSVKGMPGVVKVVVKKNFVGVVAEKPWQAIQAANKLKVTWSAGHGLAEPCDFYNYLRTEKPTRDTLLVNSKDVDEKLAQAAAVLKRLTTIRTKCTARWGVLVRSRTFRATRPRFTRRRKASGRCKAARPCCSASSRKMCM